MLFGWFLRESQSNVFLYLSGLKRKIPLSAVTRWRIMALVYTRHLLLHTALTAPTINTAKLLWPLPCPAVACCWVQTSSDGRRSSDPTTAPSRCFSSAGANLQLSQQQLTQFILAAFLSIKRKTGREELWHKDSGCYIIVFLFCEIYSGMGLGEAGEVWGHKIHYLRIKILILIQRHRLLVFIHNSRAFHCFTLHKYLKPLNLNKY